MVRPKLHDRRRRGHQERSRNTFSRDVSNDDLHGVAVDGDIVVVVTAYAARRLHHAGYFESGNGRFARRKKQALDLRGQLHVLKKIVTLPLDGFGKGFPLLDIPLDDINDKGETQHRGEIVEDPKSRVNISRRVIIMEQDANRDETVADFPA